MKFDMKLNYRRESHPFLTNRIKIGALDLLSFRVVAYKSFATNQIHFVYLRRAAKVMRKNDRPEKTKRDKVMGDL